MTSLHPKTEAPRTESTLEPSSTPQACPASGEPTKKSTCVLYTICRDIPWKDEYKDKASKDYEELKNYISKLICDFFKRFACKVEILEVSFCKAPCGGTTAIVKVCLHLKLVPTPFYFEDVQLIIPLTTNYTSEPVGVTYSEWKAKDCECKKCYEGGGPFVKESVCESKEYSCKGYKNKSQESKDRVKYCPSASSLVVGAVSNLILAMWISLFF
ncbi:uncharacterized protein LOC111344399, partial [Stylophora pistillata]|uniref:uncharacterized protein LOC111344399 n=1 Tax=Stylophora pistillata TaxID=50429 RepID=UPI000C03918E